MPSLERIKDMSEKILIVDDEVEIAIQVNGKLRAKMTIAKDEDDEKVKADALAQENVKAHIEGKNIVKVIVVKNKIVNVVIR